MDTADLETLDQVEAQASTGGGFEEFLAEGAPKPPRDPATRRTCETTERTSE